MPSPSSTDPSAPAPDDADSKPASTERPVSPTSAVGLPHRTTRARAGTDEVSWVSDFLGHRQDGDEDEEDDMAEKTKIQFGAASTPAAPKPLSKLRLSAAPAPPTSLASDAPSLPPPDATETSSEPTVPVSPPPPTGPSPQQPAMVRGLPTPSLLKPGAKAPPPPPGMLIAPPTTPVPGLAGSPPKRIAPKDTRQLIDEMAFELTEVSPAEADGAPRSTAPDVTQPTEVGVVGHDLGGPAHALSPAFRDPAGPASSAQTSAFDADEDVDDLMPAPWLSMAGLFGRSAEQRRLWFTGALMGAGVILFVNLLVVFSRDDTPAPPVETAIAAAPSNDPPPGASAPDAPTPVPAAAPIDEEETPAAADPESAEPADPESADATLAAAEDEEAGDESGENDEAQADPDAEAEEEEGEGEDTAPARSSSRSRRSKRHGQSKRGRSRASSGSKSKSRSKSRSSRSSSSKTAAAQASTSNTPPPKPSSDGPPPKPTATKKPAAESSDASASELLADAKKALGRGRNREAYQLASKSNGKKRNADAVRVMTRAACRAKDEVKARGAFNLLPLSMRKPIRNECKKYGIRFGI